MMGTINDVKTWNLEQIRRKKFTFFFVT